MTATQSINEDVQTDPIIGAPEPTEMACTYRCPFCPYFEDLPAPTCEGDCCVYSTTCAKTCSFDIDCGEQSSCWSGCCYDWNH